MPTKEELLDHPGVTAGLFFPRRLPEIMSGMIAGFRVERIPCGQDTLGACYHAPNPAGPTILFFHGNGEVMTDYFLGYHANVAALGANLLVVDYRGYGLSTGTPSLTRLLEDARASWKHAVGALGLKPEMLVIMGRSLGSLAALEAASLAGSAAGLVIESGIARPDDWVDRMRYFLNPAGVDLPATKVALAESFDHEAKMKAFKGRILVMHAPADVIVPVENARLLASYGDAARTRLHIFPRGGHNDIHFVNEREYFRTLGEFLRSAGL